MIQKISAALFLLALALDYKSDRTGGTNWQYVIAGIAACAVILNALMLSTRWALLSAWVRKAILLGSLFLFVSPWVAYLHEVPWEQYVRMAFPVFLLWGGFVIAVGMLQSAGDALWLSRLILVSATLNAIWSIYIALVVKELEMGTIRFQLSSTGLDLLFAYAMARLIVNRRSLWIFVGILLAVFIVQALTVTRTYVLIWAVMVGFAAYFALGMRRRKVIPPIPIGGALVTVTIFALLAAFVLSALESRYDTMTRWSERIWNRAQDRATVDVSFALRVAQDRGMLIQLSEQPFDFLFGRGFGSSYDLDRQYFFSNVSADLYKERERLETAFMGLWQKPDATWVPIIHNGGIFLLILFMLFYGQSLQVAWRSLFDLRISYSYRELLLWTVLAMILWAALSLLGNILFMRFTCGSMGFIVAIATTSSRFSQWMSQLSKMPPKKACNPMFTASSQRTPLAYLQMVPKKDLASDTPTK